MIDSKTAVGDYELPSGYLYETEEGTFLLKNARLREINGHEEDILSREGASHTVKSNEILGRCLIGLSDNEGHSITCDTPGGKDILSNAPREMVISDSTVLFIRLRQLTVGDKIKFKARCTDPTCGEVVTRIANLSELEVIDMGGDPTKRERTLTTSRGRVIEWKMMDGASQERAESDAVALELEAKRRGGRKTTKAKMLARRKEMRATAFMLQRTMKVDGEDATYANLGALPWSERQDIRDAFDDEGGIDTEVAIRCDCGNKFAAHVSIDGDNFFDRSAK